VTRQTALPGAEDVELAIKELTEATGKPPTALALASRDHRAASGRGRAGGPGGVLPDAR
jgi:hypothetical protein